MCYEFSVNSIPLTRRENQQSMISVLRADILGTMKSKKSEEAHNDGPMGGWRVRQTDRVRERQSQRKRDRDRGTKKERQREMSEREVRVRHTQRKKENGKRLKKYYRGVNKPY